MTANRIAGEDAGDASGNAEDSPGENPNALLYEELGDLARFVDKAIRTLTEFAAPMNAVAKQLPWANEHLADLRLLTEEGTHEVMRLVEAIQDSHQRVTKGVTEVVGALSLKQATPETLKLLEMMLDQLAADDKRLIDIMTALSFQDLVAQRVLKLVNVIEDVQRKLLELVVVFGLDSKREEQPAQGQINTLLKQLEESKTTVMNQDLADEILKQFGFN